MHHIQQCFTNWPVEGQLPTTKTFINGKGIAVVDSTKQFDASSLHKVSHLYLCCIFMKNTAQIDFCVVQSAYETNHAFLIRI